MFLLVCLLLKTFTKFPALLILQPSFKQNLTTRKETNVLTKKHFFNKKV